MPGVRCRVARLEHAGRNDGGSSAHWLAMLADDRDQSSILPKPFRQLLVDQLRRPRTRAHAEQFLLTLVSFGKGASEQAPRAADQNRAGR
jgi:hypothetical protein